MREVDSLGSGGELGPPVPTLSAAEMEEWIDRLTDVPDDLTDVERIDRIAQLERLKSAAASAQARLTVDFDISQRAAQEAAGVPGRRVGVGIAAQVALARREHPVRGQQHLGLAKVLVREMPHTLAALTGGRLSEWQAMLLARETGCLSLEHRRMVDQQCALTRPLSLASATARSRPLPSGSPSSSTLRPSSAEAPGRGPTGGSPSVPRRTPWPG